ncbi:cytochrome c oxidase assembly factor 5 [Phoenix dactylifera]|uniref:Cytochrome c oxidase assembly factor 5 n=2 Tax=Arecaceae TaxID=4710 RepID=A0A8B7D4D5_PHODC|nr:cytochrome c oxidase assembly factor 5 [Phoenix dactylifera]
MGELFSPDPGRTAGSTRLISSLEASLVSLLAPLSLITVSGFKEERGESKCIKMSKSCKGLAMELVKCLSESDCVKVEKRPYRECAGEKVPSIPSECVGLRETYFNCKRGQVDMRARIRGNKGY